MKIIDRKFEFMYFSRELWASECAKIITDDILCEVAKVGRHSIILTGGSNAKKLYVHMANTIKLSCFSNCDFYLSDERYVKNTDISSNYGMIFKELFGNKPPNANSLLHEIFLEGVDFKRSAIRYKKLLPNNIDILILGVGNDGHVASIFQENEVKLKNKLEKIIEVNKNPKDSYRRISIGLPVINSAKKIFLLAPGDRKEFLLGSSNKSSFTRSLFEKCQSKIICFCTK
jgi:6-phosphogluconolactonase/glucosamine-6-phosphate isomerase/deaminase